MTIPVFLSRKFGKPTERDLQLQKIVKEIMKEEEPLFKIKIKYLDVVIFDEEGWLEFFPNNTIANYNNRVKSNVGASRALLGLRKVYLTKILHMNKEKIRQVIKHELVHIKLNPLSKKGQPKHGKEFQKCAEKFGITGEHKYAKSYLPDSQWKHLKKSNVKGRVD